jgi:hypothetical protein
MGVKVRLTDVLTHESKLTEVTPEMDVATCGTCHRSWDDARVTGITPAPGARCPFEALHDDINWDAEFEFSAQERGREDRAKCVHKPNMDTLHVQHDDRDIYVDVSCAHCGLSGCIAKLDTDNINWD